MLDPLLTNCDNGVLLEIALLALPPYVATIECTPAPRPPVAHAAVGALPAPKSGTAPQPLIRAPLSVKPTVPVGALPFTVAVKVTLAPTVDGLDELVTVVLVG